MTDINLVFTEITEADLPELTEVMTRVFDDDIKKHLGVEKGGPEGYDNGEFFRKWLFGYEWTIGYKVVSENTIIGAVIVWVFDTGNNHLGTIFVDPKFQDRGVGARTWEFVESTFPETKSWQLETPSFATKNHHFYEKCGFRKIEVKPAEGDMPGESWVYRKEMAPNQSLQLTAGSCGFLNVFWVVMGFGLSDVFGKPPLQLNFFVRWRKGEFHDSGKI